MSEDIEPTADGAEIIRPPSHERILWIMAVLGVVGGILGFVLSSPGFGLGVLVGTALAFVNYYWLRSSLRKIFSAAELGERPRMLAGKYFLRYIILAIVIAVIYVTGALPIVAVVMGMAGFGFAVVIEGMIRMVAGL
ncbi:MAG TPA: ATP synthase subunit I [Pyrinomonadaceae bacterium]|nr:ATP synthase subunit I [Pyrinomonadaceae bacterium]